MADQPSLTAETLRTTAEALGLTVSAPYRIGLGHDLDRLWLRIKQRNWGYARYTLRLMYHSARDGSWWGLWQCEGTLGLRARRGLTAAAAERRMLEDEIGEKLGYRSAYQQRWARG
ncbi:hypothetical protein [Planobispora longispora]|uniref:Uncharacterized protein n=1 Tax=Planobispora longispora TaxID=28887 RepID=A0A8J3W536_9ACTN|nr:hypothetical protein [Planobispora longispora]BFE85806.1 hypothetical protein GCM10020093_084070 [Planobispora longispora]GIH76160.1 hypothetical protein Plo01_25890 [Planobispora longispora]